MSEEEKNKIEDVIDIILRGNDIESSALILEKAIMDNYIIAKGRVNILKIATRQILNFIEEYKNKGSLDIIKEKVKANDKITKLQKENEELRKGQKSLMQSRKKWKDRYYKLKKKSKKIIDLMAENKEEIEKIEEIDFLMKIREISKTHTCSYGAILDLLLEIILHFSTKELVDILEVKLIGNIYDNKELLGGQVV